MGFPPELRVSRFV